MMKKWMSLFMAGALVCGLTACAGAKVSAEVSQEKGNAAVTEGQETAADVQESENAGLEDGSEKAEAADNKEDTGSETKTAVDKAKEERMAATIKDVEMKAVDIPDNAALAFVKDMKAGWNLGNSLDAHNNGTVGENELSTEETWGNPVTTQAMIDEIQKAGFGTIRIPITWRGHAVIGEDGSVTVSEVWVARVKEVVDYAYNNGMYVIINTHHDVDAQNGYYPNSENYERSEKYLTAIWTAMAETFKDYDEHLIFESLNEPRLVGSSYEWNFRAGVSECDDAADCINRLNQKFVDVVRASGGNNAERYLMLPGYAASVDGAVTDRYQLPKDSADNKLIVSVHAYTPYKFALQPENESGSTDKFDLKKSASTADIDALMSQLYKKYISQGIPVVIGEYGARDKNNNLQERLDYYVYYVSTARAHGITCCVWDNNSFSGNGEKFGLFRRRVCNWLYPEIVEAILKYA